MPYGTIRVLNEVPNQEPKVYFGVTSCMTNGSAETSKLFHFLCLNHNSCRPVHLPSGPVFDHYLSDRNYRRITEGTWSRIIQRGAEGGSRNL